MCFSLNFRFGSGTGGKAARDAVKLLKTGMAPTRRPPQNKMRREDGFVTTTYADEAEVLAKHVYQLYGRIPAFDPSILDLIPQAPPFLGIDGPSTDDEVAKSVSRFHGTRPGAS